MGKLKQAIPAEPILPPAPPDGVDVREPVRAPLGADSPSGLPTALTGEGVRVIMRRLIAELFHARDA